MLKLIKFEFKKSINTKTILLFFIFFILLFIFVFYNMFKDKSYDCNDKIYEYHEEESLISHRMEEIKVYFDKERKKLIKAEGLSMETITDKQFLIIRKKVANSPDGILYLKEYDLWKSYQNLINRQIGCTQYKDYKQINSLELEKNKLVLEGIKNNIIKGKIIRYDFDEKPVFETVEQTKLNAKYNRIINDKSLETSNTPYQMKGFNFLINAVKLFVPIIFPILICILCHDVICGEQKGGSFKFLLLQPYSRVKIYLSKYICSMIQSILLFIIPTLIVFIITSIINGIESYAFPIICSKNAFSLSLPIDNTKNIITILQYTLRLLFMSIIYISSICSFVFIVSSCINDSLDSLITSILIIGVIYGVHYYIQDIPSFFYIIPIINSDFANILNGDTIFNVITTLLIFFMYNIFFMFIGTIYFKKKNIVC